MALTKYKLGELIYEIVRTNTELEYGMESVRGISNTKMIMPTKADVDESVLHKFYIIFPGEFIYNPRTTRMGEKVGLVYNNTPTPLLFTFNNIAFGIKKCAKKLILADYLYIYFNRAEFDRYAMTNSWGSATELFTFAEMCDIDIELPDLPTQQKYVDIYKAMVANQQSYERGLEDLKLTADALIEKFKHNTKRIPLGNIVEESDVRNEDGSLTAVQGVNKDKQFMPTVVSGAELTKYKIVTKNQFACNLMHVGRDVAIPVSLQTQDEYIIVSPAYLVFSIKDKSVIPEYALIWMSRCETERYAWFISDTSIRGGIEKKRFYEIDIPVPTVDEQKSLVEIYNALSLRRNINERLKAQIKDICPILIKGSMEEGK
jgi:type I restriction enzyme S subunit